MIFTLLKIDIPKLIGIKAQLSKEFHIQPSEIDAMPYWEYEMYVKEISRLVEEQNKQQESEMKKYDTNKLQKQSQPQFKQPTFNMPSINMNMPKF